MEYTFLGRSGLKVSRLCLGTMNFGPHTSEKDSFAIMDKALEMGINFFDTANVYGWKIGEGITEKIVGRWLSQGGGRREQIVLASKVFGKMGEGVNDRKLSAYHIKRACEQSLLRMKTDHIDLYQMHHIDRDVPWEEVWQAMELLVREGKVTYIGSSNFAAWNIAEANCIAAQRNFMGLVSEQSLYNLTTRMAELEIVPVCKAFGLGLIPWSPLANGLLGGMLKESDTARRKSENIRAKFETVRTNVEAYEAFCHHIGEKPADVALAWLLHNPVVAAPIIGPRTMDHLVSSARALELKLNDAHLEELDNIWPGPGNQAPEAYAW